MYAVNHKAGNIVDLFGQIQFICYQNDDNSLSYSPYKGKGVITTKLLFNFTNLRPENPHRYK